MNLLQATEINNYFLKQGLLGVLVVGLILFLIFMIKEYRGHLWRSIKESQIRETEHKANIKEERDKSESINIQFFQHLVNSEKKYQEISTEMMAVLRSYSETQKQLNEVLTKMLLYFQDRRN